MRIKKLCPPVATLVMSLAGAVTTGYLSKKAHGKARQASDPPPPETGHTNNPSAVPRRERRSCLGVGGGALETDTERELLRMLWFPDPAHQPDINHPSHLTVKEKKKREEHMHKNKKGSHYRSDLIHAPPPGSSFPYRRWTPDVPGAYQDRTMTGCGGGGLRLSAHATFPPATLRETRKEGVRGFCLISTC